MFGVESLGWPTFWVLELRVARGLGADSMYLNTPPSARKKTKQNKKKYNHGPGPLKEAIISPCFWGPGGGSRQRNS